MHQVVAFFRDALDWSGTTGRMRFALACLLALTAAMIWGGVWVVFGLGTSTIMAASLAFSLSLILFTGHTVRRLHALGRSGGWALLSAVPVLSIGLIFWLLIRKGDGDRDPVPSGISRWAGALLIGLFALAVLSRSVWEPYWIPSGSMKPTLLVGDYIAAVGVSDAPTRGDVVIFRNPSNGSDYIKRVIGLPGDTVQMRGGVPILNGTKIMQTDDGTFVEPFAPQGGRGDLPNCTNRGAAQSGNCLKPRMVETLPNGRSYPVLDIRRVQLDETPFVTVPPGHYFVLGDNRDNSMDSRVALEAGGAGFIPLDAIQGRAARVIFSSAGRSLWAFWTWRPDRFMVPVP